MSLKNTKSHYGVITRTFHWLMILTVLTMITVGFTMDGISDKGLKSQLFAFHKSLGLTVLVIMLLFFLWSLFNRKPALPDHEPRWQQIIAHSVHGLLYLLIIATPIAGWAYSTAAGYPPKYFGLFTIPAPWILKNKPLAEILENVHVYLAWTVSALLTLHVLAAFKHWLIDKDGIMQRMLLGRD